VVVGVVVVVVVEVVVVVVVGVVVVVVDDEVVVEVVDLPILSCLFHKTYLQIQEKIFLDAGPYCLDARTLKSKT